MTLDWCCIAAVNNPDILASNLAASRDLQAEPFRLHVQFDAPSCSIAYRRGLVESDAEIVVFAHQDVYLPDGWVGLLSQRIEQLDRLDPNWGVAGLFGVGEDGQHHGRSWSTGLGRQLGIPSDAPVPALCVDEMVIVLKRSSGLTFDEALPNFHLYGLDIVTTARVRGIGAYIIDAPIIHNSQPVQNLDGGFAEAYHYMQSKWADRLPLQNLIAPIETSADPLHQAHQRLVKRKLLRRLIRLRGLADQNWRWLLNKPDAPEIARHLGYQKE
jgi:hypothetical protein